MLGMWHVIPLIFRSLKDVLNINVFRCCQNVRYDDADLIVASNTPCPEKNGTNNVLGITLANTNI